MQASSPVIDRCQRQRTCRGWSRLTSLVVLPDQPLGRACRGNFRTATPAPEWSGPGLPAVVRDIHELMNGLASYLST